MEPKFNLSWNSYQKSICTGFAQLQQKSEFVDMTLAADGHFVKVHQSIIALASPYLMQVIKSVPCKHPVLFLDISYEILSYILEYIYTGEVDIEKNYVTLFLKKAKALGIHGIISDMDKGIESSSTLINDQGDQYVEDLMSSPQMGTENNVESTNDNDDREPTIDCQNNYGNIFDDGNNHYTEAANENQDYEDIIPTTNDNNMNTMNINNIVTNKQITSSYNMASESNGTGNFINLPSLVSNSNNYAEMQTGQYDFDTTISIHPVDETHGPKINNNQFNIKINYPTSSNNDTEITNQFVEPAASLPVIENMDISIDGNIEIDRAEYSASGMHSEETTQDSQTTEVGNTSVQNIEILIATSLPIEANESTEFSLCGSETNDSQSQMTNESQGQINLLPAPIPEPIAESRQTKKMSQQISIKHQDSVIDIPVDSFPPTGNIVQYSISNRGSLQLIMNRFLYATHYKSSKGVKRRWRCVDYRTRKCKAFVDMDGEVVVHRVSPHNHPFHDEQILKKVRLGRVFSKVTEAVEKSKELTHLPNVLEDLYLN